MSLTDIDAAVAELKRAGVVAFPTDTVFGLGARVDDPVGIARIYALKRRPAHKALAILCADFAQFAACAASDARRPAILALAREFLPGALTIVCAKSSAIDASATGGGANVGLRIPDHAWCRALLARTGPLAVTSANRSGGAPYAGEGEFPLPEVAVFGADEPSGNASGVPSTVIDFRAGAPRVLRAGAITAADLAAWYARYEGQSR